MRKAGLAARGAGSGARGPEGGSVRGPRRREGRQDPRGPPSAERQPPSGDRPGTEGLCGSGASRRRVRLDGERR